MKIKYAPGLTNFILQVTILFMVLKLLSYSDDSDGEIAIVWIDIKINITINDNINI